ncbi:LacI family DNA-binding transcriptional regulator [uncultured Limosilactobacillus sp.]|uniref:LacI family DNA-binding transcriptional regulator n=1 Tax=uncultured Limosilactobacillus sp. TaxID=2837629 RepID=UPI0025EDF743|nr:LacI family DNA-binding transcriptional regulator [uncultured Limosilactobacillus sp.]
MSTIKDVARQAGVSVSTASRALNNNPRISDATRQRVRQAAAKLGYRLNYAAKNLTSGKSNIVGLVFPVTEEGAFANPFHLDLMRGVAAKLAPHHYEMAVAIGQTTTELLDHVKSLVENANVTKLLVFYSLKDDPVITYLRQQELDFVIIGQAGQAGDRFVDSDNRLAGYQGTAALMKQKGVNRPLFVVSAQHWPYEEERLAGYREQMARQKLPIQEATVDQPLAADHFDSLIASDDVNYLHFVTSHPKLASLPALCFNNSRLLGMIMPGVMKVDLLPRAIGSAAVELLFDPATNHRLVDFQIIN